MSRFKFGRARAAALLAMAIAALGLVSVQGTFALTTSTVPNVSQGWIDSGGTGNNPASTGFQNVIVQQNSIRNWTSFTLPASASTATAARLVINRLGSCYSGTAATYTLWDVTAPASAMTGAAAYNDLGSGTQYATANLALPLPAQVFVPLNTAAINAIRAAAGGRFAVGGTGSGAGFQYMLGCTGGNSNFALELTTDGVVDTTAPTVTATPNPAPNGNGWNSTGVVVSLNAADNAGGSGVKSITYSASGAQGIGSTTVNAATAAVAINAPGTTVLTYTAVDVANNTSTSTAITVRVDTVLPSLAGTLTMPANGYGWYNAPVTVDWTASDAHSGLATPASFTTSISGEGAGVRSTAAATDRAGNTSTVQSPPASIDVTNPATNVTVNGQGLQPWYSTLPVSVAVTGQDNLSGVERIDYTLDGMPNTIIGTAGPVSITSEGRHVLSVSSVDSAGNAEPARDFGVNVDLGAPQIVTIVDPAPTGTWNNEPVVVSAACTDPNLADGQAGSGVSACAVDGVPGIPAAGGLVSTTSRSSEGRFVLPATAADSAGNQASSSVAVNIDKTAPTVTAAADRAADHIDGIGTGWYNAPVTVTFACADPVLASGDDGSGVADCAAPVRLSDDGRDQSAAGASNDLAGNAASASVVGLNVDGTAPAVTWLVNGSAQLQAWYNGPVTVTFACADAISGVAACPQPVTLSHEGSSQVAVGTAVDAAGNTTVVEVSGINIDLTRPVLTATLDPAPVLVGAALSWNSGPVTVHWTCTDPSLADGSQGAGVADCPADQVVSGDGANQPVAAQVADRAGNAGNGATLVNIDQTGPVVTGSATPAPNATGWYRNDVTVAWSAIDALSGVDASSVPEPTVVTGEGAALGASAAVLDNLGNEGTGAVSPIRIDRTAPKTLLAAQPPAWSNVGVTLELVANDNLSGVATTSWSVDGGAPHSGTAVAIATEGRHVVRFSSVDNAGNVEAPVVATVDIDRSAPEITAAQSPLANGAGWNNGPVTVTFTCVDPSLVDGAAGSGIEACTAPTTVGTEGAGQHVTGSARDTAGNTASVVASVSIDRTTPAVTGAATTDANGRGWYRTPVTVSFACVDPLGANTTAGSGVVSCETQKVLAADGAGLSATATAVDAASNTGSGTVGGINLDQAAPTITAVPSVPNGTNGWYRNGATVHFDVADSGSGIDETTRPGVVAVNGDGAGKVASATVADVAGNTAAASATVDLDGTAPLVVASLSVPVPNGANGWWTTPVTVTFTCTDGTSGVAAGSCPTTQVLGNGRHAAQSFTVADVAGNTSTVSVPEVNVDVVAPTIVFTGNAGTYTIDQTVSITCTATDLLSGINAAGTSCPSVSAPAYSLLVGANQTNVVTASAKDVAGNTSSASTSFKVGVTCQSMAVVTAAFTSDVSGANGLLAKIDSICSAPNANAKAGKVGAFTNQLKAKTGKDGLTAVEADYLIKLASLL